MEFLRWVGKEEYWRMKENLEFCLLCTFQNTNTHTDTLFHAREKNAPQMHNYTGARHSRGLILTVLCNSEGSFLCKPRTGVVVSWVWAQGDFWGEELSILSGNLGAFMYHLSQTLRFVGAIGLRPGESLVGTRAVPALSLRNPNSLSSPSVRLHSLFLGVFNRRVMFCQRWLCQLGFLAIFTVPPSGRLESDFPKLCPTPILPGVGFLF